MASRKTPSTAVIDAKPPRRVPTTELSATRQRMLEVAEALFYKEGFHTVGLDRVLREVGISKQGFYRHFTSKEDLVVEVVKWHDRWWREQCRTYLLKEAGTDARGQLLALVKLFTELLEGADFHGCFFINAISQFPSPLDPIHQAAVAAKENIDAMVRDLALCAGVKDPVTLARELAVLFEGAFVLRRMLPALEVTTTLGRMTTDLLSRHLPATR